MEPDHETSPSRHNYCSSTINLSQCKEELFMPEPELYLAWQEGDGTVYW